MPDIFTIPIIQTVVLQDPHFPQMLLLPHVWGKGRGNLLKVIIKEKGENGKLANIEQMKRRRNEHSREALMFAFTHIIIKKKKKIKMKGTAGDRLGHVQTFSFLWENCHSPGRNPKCTNIHVVSFGPTMAVLGEK